MLKGQFFQALHVKWQRKLGAPKPQETFASCYDRARTLEQHEKQYAASAASKSDTHRSRMSKQANRLRTQLHNVRIQELSPFLQLPPPIPRLSDVVPTTEDVLGEAFETISHVGSPDHLRKLLVIQTLLVPPLLDKYLNWMIFLMSS